MAVAEMEVLSRLATKSEGISAVDKPPVEKSLAGGTITFNYPYLSGTDKLIMLGAARTLSELTATNLAPRINFVDEPHNETSIPQAHEDLDIQIDWIFKDDAGLSNNMYQRVIARAFTDYLTCGDLNGSLFANPRTNPEYDVYEHFGPLIRAKVFSLLAIATKRDFPDKELDNSIRCALQAVDYLKRQAGQKEAAANLERRLKEQYFKADFWRELTPFSTTKPVESNGHHEQNGRFRLPWIGNQK